MTANSPILSCSNVSKDYLEAGQPLSVLKGVSFQIAPGEMLGIVGSSGSGKSTLLHLLGALDKPSAGQIKYKDSDIFAMSAKEQAQYRNSALGFVYQFHHLLGEFDALENVAMPLLIGGVNAKQANERASAMLDNVGLSDRASHRPAQLSGGERQRVAIARALVNEPGIVLADEPTGNLDHQTGETIYQLLLELRLSLSTSFIVVTHDNALANRLDRVLLMNNGQLEPANA